MVHASVVGSCFPSVFIPYTTRSHLRVTASPLLRPLELAKTCRRTHVHTLCSHGRYVFISFPISRYAGTNAASSLAMSILVLAEASGAIFYNAYSELVYLCLQVGLTFIYSLLVAGRLFSFRMKMRDTLGRGHVRTYETAAMMVVESAAIYSTLGIIFIVSFALHSNISNLVFLSISHVQVSPAVFTVPFDRGVVVQQCNARQCRAACNC